MEQTIRVLVCLLSFCLFVSLIVSFLPVGMVQICVRGGSHFTLGNISLVREWPNPGTAFLESQSMSQACQYLRHLDNALNNRF